MISSDWFCMSLCSGPNASGLNAMCWLPHHRFTRESHSQKIAVPMNSHAVFIYPAGCQVDCISAYPAEMCLFELGIFHLATSLDMRDGLQLTARGGLRLAMLSGPMPQ